MAVYVVRLPDVGEGVAQAELVEWLVNVGDPVTPDSALAEVLTDKATVEIACPVSGTVVSRWGEPGEVLAVGSDLVGIETDADQAPGTAPAPARPPVEAASPDVAPTPEPTPSPTPTAAPVAAAEPSMRTREVRPPRDRARRPLAAPAVRRAALDRGIDLRLVRGSGDGGRILRADLDAFAAGEATMVPAAARRTSVTETVLGGVRRTIARRMNVAWQTPHITYVDEVDLTETEKLRATLNARHDGPSHLTILPFVVRAIVLACAEHPIMNSTFDNESETLTTHGAIHVGIATQTDAGLVVPVIRHAEALSLTAIAAETARLAEAARAGRATRDELGGSTITISSLGRLGGLITTPILNHPEVAVIGVNKLQVRPVWDDRAVVPRTMMNLSSSFDHRVVDGWDAAVFVQRIKELLEMPALLFVEESSS